MKTTFWKNPIVWGMLLFLALKIPMLFSAYNPEELKDFDHFVQFSEGSMPYKDYVWIYGPLSPILYGTALKALPHYLITVRVLSLLIWSLTAFLIVRLLFLYVQNPRWQVLSVLAATSCIGYPSYNHNHVLVTFFLVATAYQWICYQRSKSVSHLRWALIASIGALFVRPILTGYGALGLSLFLLLRENQNWKFKLRESAMTLGVLCLGLGFFWAIYGPGVKYAFMPLPWTILTPKAYPSLHYLSPQHWFAHTEWLPFFRALRTSLETFVFYFHFFIWPTVAITLFLMDRQNKRLQAMVLCAAFALMGSLDVLHYGFSRPDLELAMTVRGQFFFALTLCSILIALSLPAKVKWERRFGFVVLLFIVCWGYYPMAARVSQMVRYQVNSYNIPVLRGVFTDPKRDGLLKVAQFIGERCHSDDAAVFMEYLPGVRHFVPCKDVFERDVFAFTRMPWYEFRKFENPYVPEGNISSAEFLRHRIDESQSSFIVMSRTLPPFLGDYCKSPDWGTKTFEAYPLDLTVCYRVAKGPGSNSL